MRINNITLGNDQPFILIAGPCAIENLNDINNDETLIFTFKNIQDLHFLKSLVQLDHALTNENLDRLSHKLAHR